MPQKHIETLKKLYADWAKGDAAAVLSACADDVTFQVPGRAKLAGKYTRATFPELLGKVKELSGGTYHGEVHDILASEMHATVLLTAMVTRNGARYEYRTVHVWRMQSGKPVAWYEYPRDLYQYDTVWA